MNSFQYHNNELFIEKISLKNIAAEFGTPVYVYSRAALENNWRRFDNAFSVLPHKICYAVKANSNLTILKLFADLGSGFDIVSVGELERVLKAGGDPKKIVFSGVGKRIDEIERAIEVGILCFNVESEQELYRIHMLAKKNNKKVQIALRVNPNINPETHPYISTGLHENKFGIELEKIMPLALELKKMDHVELIGIACHIGSQLTQLSPFLEAIESLLSLKTQLTQLGFSLQHLDIGGGLGVRYANEQPPTIEDYASALIKKLGTASLELLLEPGRLLVAEAGVLLTRVEYLKDTGHKNFAIVDAGMNDLIRPALYQAWQEIKPVYLRTEGVTLYDVAGPVCESADFLGKDRELAIKEGDLLAVCTAGAYGFSMASNYNSRGKAAEVLVSGTEAQLIRRRERIEDLYAHEL